MMMSWGLGPFHKKPSGSIPTLLGCSALVPHMWRPFHHSSLSNLCWKVVTTRGSGISPVLALGFF